jgi:hypothetical protein
LIALNVARVLGMLPTVDFDDEAPLMADKIHNEATDWCLPPEA